MQSNCDRKIICYASTSSDICHIPSYMFLIMSIYLMGTPFFINEHHNTFHAAWEGFRKGEGHSHHDWVEITSMQHAKFDALILSRNWCLHPHLCIVYVVQISWWSVGQCWLDTFHACFNMDLVLSPQKWYMYSFLISFSVSSDQLSLCWMHK